MYQIKIAQKYFMLDVEENPYLCIYFGKMLNL